MTSNDLIAAAIANREKRLAQVAALHPIRKEARERASELGSQIERAKRIGEGARFTRSMHWVPGFFPTPPALVARMIEASEFKGIMRVLEPSCGKGNIALSLVRLGHSVLCVEKVPALAEYCRKQGLEVECADFLELTPEPFDRVLMNPPFEHKQDEQHIRRAYTLLKPGGRLVAICSAMAAARMASWVNERGWSEELPENAFKNSERSTGVQTAMLVLNR